MKQKTIIKISKSNSRKRIRDIVIHRSLVRVFLPAFVICLLSQVSLFADIKDSAVDETRAALEKWVETCRIISQEKHDFKLAREMLSERIELLESEIESMLGKIKETEESITEADKKRAELIEENEKLKEASNSLSDVVINLEDRTKELLKRLPDPIQDRVKPLSQRFPEDPDKTKLSLGERFQNIVGVLNEVNKFNSEITVTSEVHELQDGVSAEVTAIYIGIGHSYYINGNGDAAGVGTVSSDGWNWTPVNESAAEVSEAISIFQNETAAKFVQLPIKIQ